ncbi:MAG TPA: sigma-70 family RNA polymerase sigma factor, partial [Actinomycetota bacterium]|nr:sigma-70 family RNA polymerase sigma factor [Actinomycetota bacterium]
GDQRSLEALYDRYGNAALGLAFKVCGNRAIAEDIVQEAFLALWQRPESFDSTRGSAGSFLMGIVHHKAVDAVRREAAVHRREENFAVELQEFSEDEVVEAAWVAMRKSKVLAALRQLSDVQREALELAYLQGLTYSDVAAKLNIPLGTAKTRMRDGMIRLRTLLAQSEVTGS